MNSSQNGGKSKSSRSSSSRSSSSNSKTSSSNSNSSSKSKKGGNFLGSVSELFVPTGWENFATAAGLLAIDRADAAFRRSRNSSKKQKGGGADLDGHESIENMEQMMDTLNDGSDSIMSGGAKKPKSKKSTSKKSTAKKSTAKKSTSKTKKTKKSTK